MSEGLTYQKAGVDPEKAAGTLARFAKYLKSRPQDPNVLASVGPFAACYDLAGITQNYTHPILVSTCDGVGTKVKLALDWDCLEEIGQDLVAMNVNDLLCMGAKPLFFLDYFATGKLDSEQLLGLLTSIQKGCEKVPCSLVGGETAEMPGVYHGDDFDLAGFSVGVAEKSELLGPARVVAGDVLVALESTGPHSNGFSLIRKLVEKENLQPNARTPFGEKTWKETLLVPTPIYVKPLSAYLPKLHALVHVTGGGLYENLPRVLPQGIVADIDSKSWPLPPLFKWMQEKADLKLEQLLSTFNCGVGMIALLPAKDVAGLTAHLKAEGIRAWTIGAVRAASAGEETVNWK